MPTTAPVEPTDWIKVVAVVVAILSLLFNVWQYVRTRRHVVQLRFQCVPDGVKSYVRLFCVDLTNWGADLYDVVVVMRAKSKEGKDVVHFGLEDDSKPNPFKLGQSWRFYVENDDPTKSRWGLDALDPKDVSIVVYSGVNELRRVTAKKFKGELDRFAKADPSLPLPQTETIRNPLDYKGRW